MEEERIRFLEQRDGVSGAKDFCRRTMKIYRAAVLTSAKRGFGKPHHASFREYRRGFIQSYLEFKRYAHSPNAGREPGGTT